METSPDEVKEPVVDNESEPYPEEDISEEEDEDDDDEDDYHEDDDKVRGYIAQKTWASINLSDVYICSDILSLLLTLLCLTFNVLNL